MLLYVIKYAHTVFLHGETAVNDLFLMSATLDRFKGRLDVKLVPKYLCDVLGCKVTPVAP